jgi:GT2 family glycosyltransferase
MIDRNIENKVLDRTSIKQGNEPRVAIIILNWNGWQDTLECLESVRQLDYPNYLTIVVDNGSWDDSLEKIRARVKESLGEGYVLVEYAKTIALRGGEDTEEEILELTSSKARMVLIKNEENLGFTGGNNVAIHYALHRKYPVDYIFLLNNDAKVERDCLNHLVAVDCESNAGIVGAVVMNEPGGQIQFAKSGSLFRHFFISLVRGQQLPVTKDKYWLSPIVYGAGMIVRRDVLDALYNRRRFYWNPDLFAYGDEFDFCYYAYKMGYKSVVSGNAIVYHGKRNQPHRPYNPIFFHYYSTRNHILLAKILPSYQRILFHLFYLPLCIRRVLKLSILNRTNISQAIICGLIDGYRGIAGKWKYHDREELKCRDIK